MNAHEINLTLNLQKLFLIAIKSEILGLHFINKELIIGKIKASIQKLINSDTIKSNETKKLENLHNEIQAEAGKIIVLCKNNDIESAQDEFILLEKKVKLFVNLLEIVKKNSENEFSVTE